MNQTDDEFFDVVGTDIAVVHKGSFDFLARQRKRDFEKFGIKYRVEEYKDQNEASNET